MDLFQVMIIIGIVSLIISSLRYKFELAKAIKAIKNLTEQNELINNDNATYQAVNEGLEQSNSSLVDSIRERDSNIQKLEESVDDLKIALNNKDDKIKYQQQTISQNFCQFGKDTKTIKKLTPNFKMFWKEKEGGKQEQRRVFIVFCVL